MAEFADRLRQLREAKGISQQQLSDYLNVNKQTISGYERGVRRPAGKGAQELYEKMADYFNVDISYLMGFTDTTTKIIRYPNIQEVLPNRIAEMYRDLDEENKEYINQTIYEKFLDAQEYERILKLKQITNIKDAQILLRYSAAFHSSASTADLIHDANEILKDIQKKRKQKETK